MKKLILMLAASVFLLGCSDKDIENQESTGTWKGVFFDHISNIDIHDPQFNYTLIIDSLNNVNVILPSEGVEEKVISIEILNDSEMDITWVVNNKTRVVSTGYSYNNQNELVIDKFNYTVATIPFPNNLTSAKFIKETHLNNK
ncbi:hypothetical protein [Gelatiniphilus marinus]|uniref:Lipocalin-like domain-containing protein n=1 Tax=Gelatiniphilus marinus TaxID=1759464 RepID=A0ABW5JWW4_9FLAO